MKLFAHPLAVWVIARALALPEMETKVVTLMASIAMGANVYLMARQFEVMEGEVAGGLVLSTVFAAITSPLLLAILF
jgi:predicted permease